MKWETVVGLEVHAQLNTRSKIFSGAATAFGAAPNTQACAVDIALPGVLPVLNREAVAKAIRFGLAVGGEISPRSIFARKNYFYPDLPKGYQISQYEMPIVQGGTIGIIVDGKEKTIRLTRAHLEEDAGKSLHEDFRGASGIDLNRAGTPLLEIVSEPDMRSSQEAVAYAKALHALVRWIDICDGNMQEGSFRCDANVSVRPAGGDRFGTRCEIKNLNSFRFLERAIEFEARRQIDILEDGGAIVQETRLYDSDRDETRSMRSKEDAHDYRYFPDPDLLPLEVSEQWIYEIRMQMPELPWVSRDRYVRQYGLSSYDATLLNTERELADYFETTLAVFTPSERVASAKQAANLITGFLRPAFVEGRITSIGSSPISPGAFAELVRRRADGTLSSNLAQVVFEAMWAGEGTVDEIIARRGLKQISDSSELEKIVDQVIAANAQQVADYKGGKEKAFNSLVGQAMKLSKGKANPRQVNEILKRKLSV
jgi:aspartyl-tRNA(Asn)/glutamyl-tRNA(Gln) amidotransferase subunit B